MKKQRVLRCSICRAEIEARKANPHFPFCSARCKRIDLAKWLGEEYRLPSVSEDEPPN